MKVFPDRYHTLSRSDNTGWVLVYALIFLIIIQTASLFALSIVKYNITSGSVFHSVLSKSHAPEKKTAPPEITVSTLDAPDGWDHTAFSTQLMDKSWAGEHSYSYKAALREQPCRVSQDPSLSTNRTHIIILLDDSQVMTCSCGIPYDDENTYLECSDGYTVPVPYRDDVQTSTYSREGTYFRGDYGNLYYASPDTSGFGGTISCWTHLLSYLKTLMGGLELCEIAIATTSGGIVQPFTHDIAALYRTLENLDPAAPTSPLSESLAMILDDFPQECITDRHIIVATTGISIDDGSLSEWLVDFDNDNNPQDRYIEGIGSHCLDDVAAYAASLHICVHSAGPDTAYLRNVALKGGGVFMPAETDIICLPEFVCQAQVLTQNTTHFLTNRSGIFDPEWLSKTSYSLYRAGPYDPLYLTVPPSLPSCGIATSHFMSDEMLVCATSMDHLMAVDMTTDDLMWVVSGVGGKTIRRENIIIAGPNLYGYIHALGSGPEILWRQPGDFFEATRGNVYIARGTTISQISLESGLFITESSTSADVSSLRYDPCTGLLLAGTESGMIHVFNQDLVPQDILAPNVQGPISDMRTFGWRRSAHILAFTPEQVICASRSGILWSRSLDNGVYTNAVVLDTKAYISTWNKGSGCEGMNTGRSYLLVLDALTGEQLSEKALFSGTAFGPVIDLAEKNLIYNSWDMLVYKEDISHLEGTEYISLGSSPVYD